jgi:hypothetical protein
MSGVAITSLSVAASLDGTEVFPMVQNGETKQVTLDELTIYATTTVVSDLAALSVRVDGVSAAVVSVQDYLLAQISVATGGGIVDAPADDQIYGRQNSAWIPVSVTAIQTQVDAVSALVSVLTSQIGSVSTLAAAGITERYYDFALACSDEQTAITTGTAIQFSFSRAVNLQDLVLECNSAPTSTTCAVEVRVSSSVLHSGFIHIDPGQATSRTAVVTTSIIKTSIVAWRRAFVSIASTDATFKGLKLYIKGVAP